MDGRTKYSKILKIVRELNGKIVHLEKLKTQIRMEIATDDKRVAEILRLMSELGFIQEIENFKFKIKAPYNKEILASPLERYEKRNG